LKNKKVNSLILTLFFFNVLTAQNINIFSEKEMKKQYIIEQSIENIAENNDDEEIDFTTLFDQLSYYYEHPININKRELEYDLKELKLLNQFQIISIINHKKEHGDFLTIYELQSVPLIDANDIRNIQPFIAVKSNLDASKLSFSEVIKRGQNDIFFRFSRNINTTNGQKDVNDDQWLNSPNMTQIGSPDNLYLRYRFKYQNKLSIGVTAEKDAGEAFLVNKRANKLFNYTNKIGFDYYSAHFHIRDIGKIKSLAIGDFHIQLGQGLTFWSGLAIGKSADVMGVMRNPSGIKPYTALDENRFMRGAAVMFEYRKFNFLFFGSNKKIDANLIEDTTITEGNLLFSSLQNSGIHSTINELENRDAVKETIFGHETSYQNKFLKIGLVSTMTKYNGEINRNTFLYNKFQFNNEVNWANGLNYSIIKRNLNFFGESSISSYGGIANLHGLLASLHPKFAISVLHRNFNKSYYSNYSNAVGESSRTNNESGLFTGFQLKMNEEWEISSYFDQFKFPWLRYQVNRPNTKGTDGFFQIAYHPTKKLTIYGRIRNRIKPVSETNSAVRDIQRTINYHRWNYRINFNIMITESIRLRSRVEYITHEEQFNDKEDGILLIQDFMLKPKQSKFSINARFAIFDTESYNTRIYSFENDVLYYFRIPAYYYQGARSYINIKYQLNKSIDIWLRGSIWNYSNREEIGSGYNKIEGNQKSELRAQVRIQF
tara:strand:+ start:9717 stop:11861 length:2145 start_codon:yes stop_codon:yes gene_type:complete